MKKLVVIPSEPLYLYEEKGISSWLEGYYNPNGYFDKVYLLSPLEKKRRFEYGMHIIPVSSMRHFRKLIREFQPLIVRSYGAYWATRYAILNRNIKIPVVGSIHDTNPDLIFKEFFLCDYIFSMSDHLTRLLISHGVKEKNIFTTGNRIDTELFRPLPKNSQNVCEIREQFPKGKMLLFIGRIALQKNVETIIRSMTHLNSQYFLVIIGPGNYLNLKKLSDELGVENRIYWIGPVKNDKLPYWFNAADVFVSPSLWEGFGVTLIEAASCQCKIVSSDISPINEILTKTDPSIILVENIKSDIEVADAIKFLSNESPVIPSNKSSDQIRKLYSYEAISKLEISYYEIIISEFDNSCHNNHIINFLRRNEFIFSEFLTKLTTRIKHSYKLKKIKKIFS